MIVQRNKVKINLSDRVISDKLFLILLFCLRVLTMTVCNISRKLI